MSSSERIQADDVDLQRPQQRRVVAELGRQPREARAVHAQRAQAQRPVQRRHLTQPARLR